MARRPNYGAEKRQKEIKKQQKQEEKAEKKRLRKEAAARGEILPDGDIEPFDDAAGDDEDEEGGAG